MQGEIEDVLSCEFRIVIPPSIRRHIILGVLGGLEAQVALLIN